MKRIAFVLLVAGAALAVSSARADTRVRVNVGAAGYRTAPPAVIVAPPPAVVYAPAPAVVVVPSRGYWKEVQVKTWVPERWVVRHNRWGRPERYCEPGYFTYTTQQMWVEDRDRHDDSRRHGPSYGYDRDRYSHNDRRDWRR